MANNPEGFEAAVSGFLLAEVTGRRPRRRFRRDADGDLLGSGRVLGEPEPERRPACIAQIETALGQACTPFVP